MKQLTEKQREYIAQFQDVERYRKNRRITILLNWVFLALGLFSYGTLFLGDTTMMYVERVIPVVLSLTSVLYVVLFGIATVYMHAVIDNRTEFGVGSCDKSLFFPPEEKAPWNESIMKPSIAVGLFAVLLGCLLAGWVFTFIMLLTVVITKLFVVPSVVYAAEKRLKQIDPEWKGFGND